MQVDFSSYEFNSSTGFLVLEGLNGAGKTTLLKRIEKLLSAKELRYKTTFEPGGSPIGRNIRQILLDQESYKLEPISELLFFCAERAEHVAKVIKPALGAGKLVLSDRYFYSTLAFQGYGRGIDLDVAETICAHAIQNTRPDLVILLDIDVERALDRIHKRNDGSKDDFELEEVAFHQRLKEGFLTISKTSNEPFLILDANQDQDSLWKQAEPVLERWLASIGN